MASSSTKVQLLYDGQSSIRAGVDSSIAPNSIRQDQVCWAQNVTFRESYPEPRPPWTGCWLSYDATVTKTRADHGMFQAAGFYDNPNGNPSILVQRDGRLFQIEITPQRYSVREITVRENVYPVADFTVPGVGVQVDITVNHNEPLYVGAVITISSGEYRVDVLFSNPDIVRATYLGSSAVATVVNGTPVYIGTDLLIWWDTNPENDTFAWMFQAENWMVVLQGQNCPILFNGSASHRSMGDRNQEIPPGYCGAYIQGRIWLALPNRREFIAGDLINSTGQLGSQSGVDAILKFTSNTIINEGGAFSVPSNAGPITAIIATVQLDTSLGQGPVSVYTTNSIFTVNAPADSTLWKDLTYPIQTIAQVDYGASAGRSVVNVNSDTWYRSPLGVQPFIVGRRNFNAGWGNTAMSNEVLRVLNYEAETLVEYESAVHYDNRYLLTCQPKLTSWGVVFPGLLALSFDEVSTMWNRSNPCWEGAWSGVDIFKMVRGTVDGIERCWAVACSATGELELWELGTLGYDDVHVELVDGAQTTLIVPIACMIQTRSFEFNSPHMLKQLQEGELYVDRLMGLANFSTYFRPDQYPCWVPWYTWQECNKVTDCDEFCGIPKQYRPGYRPYMRFPTPPSTILAGAANRSDRGYEFQLMIEWTRCRVRKLRLTAAPELEPLSKGY